MFEKGQNFGVVIRGNVNTSNVNNWQLKPIMQHAGSTLSQPSQLTIKQNGMKSTFDVASAAFYLNRYSPQMSLISNSLQPTSFPLSSLTLDHHRNTLLISITSVSECRSHLEEWNYVIDPFINVYFHYVAIQFSPSSRGRVIFVRLNWIFSLVSRATTQMCVWFFGVSFSALDDWDCCLVEN